ncbi:MAG: hypothetical protein ACK48V_08015 [Crocinitomicaceae bacterium]|jgi:hypothetical protein
MNKSINIFLVLSIIPAIAFSIVVGFDISIEFLRTSGKFIPYQKTIFASFAALFFLMGIRRTSKRWSGIRMVNQIAKFQWNEPIDRQRVTQVNLYLIIEAVIHFMVSLVFLILTPKSIWISCVFFALGLDHLIFCIVGNVKKLWRVGVTNKAVVVADRDFKVLYFSGLRKVSVHQQSIFFDYIKELQLSFPIQSIKPENRQSFVAQLEEKVDRDKVFFSESFKDFK